MVGSMRVISASEVRRTWRKVAAGVAQGERFLVRNRRRDVALIVPVQETARRRKSRSANLLAGTAKYRLADLVEPDTADWESA